jgi:hypothetical protein
MPTPSRLNSRIVNLIAEGRTEQALRELSDFYGIPAPSLRVGVVKGHTRVAACYVQQKRMIYASSSDILRNPFVILHEFYHHLRSMSPKKAGTERYANAFARAIVNSHGDATIIRPTPTMEKHKRHARCGFNSAKPTPQQNGRGGN